MLRTVGAWLVAGVLALSILVPLAVRAEGTGKVVLKKLGELGAAAGPAVLTPDGSAVLFYSKVENPGEPREVARHHYGFWWTLTNGQATCPLIESTFTPDDTLNMGLFGARFSPDGKRLAVIIGPAGEPTSSDSVHSRAVVLEVAAPPGEARASPPHVVPTKCALVSGACWVGDAVLVVEMRTPPYGRAPQSGRTDVALWRGDVRTVVATSSVPLFGAIASPDGTKVAMLRAASMKHADLVVLDLATHDLTTVRESFGTDDYTFDGPPAWFWSAAGDAIFVHEGGEGGGLKAHHLMRVDVATKAVTPVTATENVALVAVLDARYGAVWVQTETRIAGDRKGTLGVGGRKTSGAIISFADGRLFPLPDGQLPIGGAGKTLVLLDQATKTAYAATFELAIRSE